MNEKPINTRSLSDSIPAISVVLPVYNGEKYLAEAIDSVLAQTFSDFELIIIDDGSTDGSLRILQEYQKRDKRIRLVSRENRDLATTLNDSMDIARGVWVARMDQDDIALPQRLERQLRWLERTGADVAGSWVKCFGSWDQSITRGYQTDQAIKVDMLFKSPFVHPSVMMRGALIKQLRYDKSAEKAEDYDLWTRAARSGWVMSNVPEVLLLYRKHASQISAKSSVIQQSIREKVQRRYWAYVAESMQLEQRAAQEVLGLINSCEKLDLNLVDATMESLLRRSEGEARTAIMDNLSLFYMRVGADYPDLGARWARLNRQFGSGFALGTRCKFWFARFFRVRYGSDLFNCMKKLYSFLSR
jgi:glycosyltransferase involved in cell wall biosynthesis